MKPILAITMGDFNGIGPEVTLKSVLSPAIQKICIPILIGSMDVYEFYARRLGLKIHLKELNTIPDKPTSAIIPVFHLRKFQKPIIRPGKTSKEAGEFAGEAIEIAALLSKQKVADGLVTAPVSKEAMQRAGSRFPGQTEMLAKLCEAERFTMMLVSNKLRVGLATIHMPLRKVSRNILKTVLTEKLEILNQSLKNDFAVRQPKIAVLGLNPHAGENGTFGDEEIKYITPAIKTARRKGYRIEGPFSADGFFGTHRYQEYDTILAMYHDQGLIPLKLLGFETGVNFTAGLPIVRTSPDHGTAFEIAGKGIANPSSMIESIRLAVKIINNRKKR